MFVRNCYITNFTASEKQLTNRQAIYFVYDIIITTNLMTWRGTESKLLKITTTKNNCVKFTFICMNKHAVNHLGLNQGYIKYVIDMKNNMIEMVGTSYLGKIVEKDGKFEEGYCIPMIDQVRDFFAYLYHKHKNMNALPTSRM
jgi:hypothetical protein